MSLKKNLSLIYLVYFSRAGVFLLLLPLLIRRLDESWGIFAVLLSFIQIAATAIEFGFGVSATKDVAMHQKEPVYLSRLLSSVVSVQVLIFFAVVLIGIPILHSLNISMSEYVFVLLIILFQGVSPLWFMRGVEDLSYISGLEVLSKTLVLVLVYFGVNGSEDLEFALMIFLMGAVIPTVLGFVYLFRKYTQISQFRLSILDCLEQFQKGGVFFGVRLSGMFVSVGGSLMLGLSGHTLLAGQFAIAERVLSAVRNILFPAWDVIFPKMISLFRENDESVNRFRRISNFALILFSLVTSAFLFVFAPFLAEYFSGKNDENIIKILQVMTLVPLFVAVINSLGLSYLVAHDKNFAFLSSIVIGSLFYAVSIVIFIYGGLESLDMLFGLAVSYSASLLFSMILVLYFIRVRKE